MLKNKIPITSEEDKQLLKNFFTSDSPEASTLKRLLGTYLEHFRDVRNVDMDKGNIGLQVCSHLRAYDMIELIFDQISFTKPLVGERKNNSFR